MSLLIKGVTKHSELPDVSTPHALADLVAAVCSETEADGKITTHKGDASAHHAKTSKASEITSERFPVDRLPAMTDEKIWKGTGANVEEVDMPAAGTDLFSASRATISTPLTASIGVVTLGGTGTINGEAYAILKTKLDTGSFAQHNLYPLRLDFSKEMKLRWNIWYLECPANCTIKIYAGSVLDTVSHIGFRVEGTTIYAVSRNANVGETTVDISAYVALDTWMMQTLDVHLTPGVDVKFYVNGVLRATIDTNLPTGTSGDPHIARVDNLATTSNVQCMIMSFVYERPLD